MVDMTALLIMYFLKFDKFGNVRKRISRSSLDFTAYQPPTIAHYLNIYCLWEPFISSTRCLDDVGTRNRFNSILQNTRIGTYKIPPTQQLKYSVTL